jgi:hypothetical protein
MAELQVLTRLVRSTTGVRRAELAAELRSALVGVDEGLETPDLRAAQLALAEAERGPI